MAKDSPCPPRAPRIPSVPRAQLRQLQPHKPVPQRLPPAAAAAAGRAFVSTRTWCSPRRSRTRPTRLCQCTCAAAMPGRPPCPRTRHTLFASQQRDPSTFYPWLIHRYRYLGHRFQGTCHVAGPRSAASHAALGLLRVDRLLPARPGWRLFRLDRRMRCVWNRAARSRGMVFFPSPRAAAGLGVGLRPLDPSLGGTQKSCPKSSRRAVSACSEGWPPRNPWPAGCLQARLLGYALAVLAPRGAGRARPHVRLPLRVRHPLRAPASSDPRSPRSLTLFRQRRDSLRPRSESLGGGCLSCYFGGWGGAGTSRG